MAKIDIPIKRLMQSRIEDWVEYLIPECNKDWIIEIDAEKVPAKKESRLDKLILIDAPDERYILNIEPQGYLDPKMLARMLRYRSDIWEYTIEKGIGTPSIKQAVIYFYKEHDNKQHFLEDTWNGEETITTIRTVDNKALQADLLAVTSILAAEKFTKELVKKYIRRDMLMSSSLFDEWVEEERKEAAEKAAKESARKYIIELLSEKFDFVSKEIRDSIEAIDDIGVLDGLHKKILKIETIEDFQRLLEKAKKLS